MKYEITIQEIVKETQEEQKYPRKESVYSQIVVTDNESFVPDVIKAVNASE